MLANVNMPGKLGLLLALPMAAFLFHAATESCGRWQAPNRRPQTGLLLRVTHTMSAAAAGRKAEAGAARILGEPADQAGILETLLADMRQGGGAPALPAATAA